MVVLKDFMSFFKIFVMQGREKRNGTEKKNGTEQKFIRRLTLEARAMSKDLDF